MCFRYLAANREVLRDDVEFARVKHGVLAQVALADGAGLLCNSAAALAQDVSAAPTIGTAFDRMRTTAVADRVVPGYEPRGVRLGGFLLSPELDAGALAVDNLYASPNNAKGDIGAVVSPGFALTSQWSTNFLALTGGATYIRYLSASTEDSDLYRAKVQGRYDINPELAVSAYGDYHQNQVSRTQPGNILGLAHPLTYGVLSGGGRLAWTSNRVRVAIKGDYHRVNYDNLVFNSGLVQPPMGLNRHEGKVTGTAEYAVTSDVSLLVEASTDRTAYALSEGLLARPDRSSKKHELLIGSSFAFTDFLRGELALGYIDQQFDSPIYKNYKGFGGRLKLQLFATQLTTAEFDLSRTLNEADNPLDSNYVMTSATLKLDHELLRNVVLSPSLNYSRNSFQQIGLSETQLRAGFNAAWLLDRSLSLQAQYQHIFSWANSSRVDLNFDVNFFKITAIYKL